MDLSYLKHASHTVPQPPPPLPSKPEVEVTPPTVRTSEMNLVWRCSNCGYVFPAKLSLPDNCPSCNKPKEFFEAVNED